MNKQRVHILNGSLSIYVVLDASVPVSAAGVLQSLATRTMSLASCGRVWLSDG